MARKASPKRSSPSPEMLRTCRALIRNLAHPQQLRDNPLAQRMWASAGHDPETADPSDLTKCLIASLGPALDGLSPRQRLIVERGAFAGELNVEVAADLHVSLRHAYREQAAALRAIALHFETSDALPRAPSVEIAPDSLDLRLKLARGLEQNGQWPAAAEILERLCGEVAEPEQRCAVESRLARLYTEFGRYGLADQHVRQTLALAHAENTVPAIAKAQAALCEARLSIATGNLADALHAARRSHVDLRAQSLEGNNVAASVLLLDAINLRTEIAIGQWNATDAEALAGESRDAMRRFGIGDVAAIIETRYWQAAAHFISGHTDSRRRAESDLWACYKFAVENSHMRDAIGVAVLLASLLRCDLRPAAAIELLNPLADVVGSVGVGDNVTGFYLELGFSALNAGEVSLAAKCHDDLRNLTLLSPHLQAVAEILAARVALADGRFDASLKHAETAETGLVKVGRAAWIGPALRLQAESLARLGKTARAIRTMALALENFQVTDQPRPLLGGYLSMAALTGDSSFKAKAHMVRERLAQY